MCDHVYCFVMYLGTQTISVVTRRLKAAFRVFGGMSRVRVPRGILRLVDGLDQTTFDRTRLAQIGRWDEGQRRILCRLGVGSLVSRSRSTPRQILLWS